MASFFGEIRALSSRAIDDEDADNQPKYEVSIENTDEKSKLDKSIKLIIFAVGEIASVFVKGNFLPEMDVLISTLTYSCQRKDDDSAFYTGMLRSKSSKNVIATVHASNPGVLICNVFSSVPEEICFDATEMIYENFSPTQVLILSSHHMATYKSEITMTHERPFLKSLATSQYMAVYSCLIPRIEPPNFLSNMSASLLLKCELSKILALCVVNYIDTYSVDSLNVEVFNDLLNESILSKIVANKDAQERIRKLVKAKLSVESNIYT